MSSYPGTATPADERLRRLVPAGTSLLAALLMCLPLPLAWGVMPHLVLLLTIMWASLQPRLMPTWAAFLIGFFFDAIAGLPLGLTAFLLSAAVVAVRLGEARVEGHSLFIDWAFTALLVLAAQMLTWQLLGFVGQPAPLAPLLVQALTTILAYPLIALGAARIQRRLIGPEG
jgi:rod shape-determining protein MreD